MKWFGEGALTDDVIKQADKTVKSLDERGRQSPETFTCCTVKSLSQTHAHTQNTVIEINSVSSDHIVGVSTCVQRRAGSFLPYCSLLESWPLLSGCD